MKIEIILSNYLKGLNEKDIEVFGRLRLIKGVLGMYHISCENLLKGDLDIDYFIKDVPKDVAKDIVKDISLITDLKVEYK